MPSIRKILNFERVGATPEDLEQDWVNALLTLQDGSIAVGRGNGHIDLFDPARPGEVRRLSDHTDEVTSLVVLPDGQLASGSWDERVVLWNMSNDAHHTLHHDQKNTGICSLALLPDGRLASGQADGSIRLTRINGSERCSWLGSAPDSPVGHVLPVGRLAFLPGGKLASASDDGLVLVWDVETRREIARLRLEFGAECRYGLTALPTGQLVVTAANGGLRLWDPGAAGSTVVCASAEQNIVASVLMPDGRLATASDPGRIQIWDSPAQHVCAHLDLGTFPTALATCGREGLIVGDIVGDVILLMLEP